MEYKGHEIKIEESTEFTVKTENQDFTVSSDKMIYKASSDVGISLAGTPQEALDLAKEAIDKS